MASQTFSFGSYIPGASPLHSMNAQVKIILACVFSIAVFALSSWMGLAAIALFVSVLYAIARIPFARAATGLKPVAAILLFTVLAHAVSFTGVRPEMPGSLGFSQHLELVGGVSLSLDGLFTGLFFALRITVVVGVCGLLTFTSSTMQVCDALFALLRPLRHLHIPVEDVCMVISLALSLIPTTADEAAVLVDARRARGAALGSGPLRRRITAWAGVLSPLVVRLFKRADSLACAMDARAYAGTGRTHLRASCIAASDIALGCVLAALVVCWCVIF